MTDAVKLSDLKYPHLQDDGSGLSEPRRHRSSPRQTRAGHAPASASSPRETESPMVLNSLAGIAPGIAANSQQVGRDHFGHRSARRWGAIGIFRLASGILRRAKILHRQRRISHSGLRTVLSGTRLLERFGALLARGPQRKRQQIE
jgi:hypothetical protein